MIKRGDTKKTVPKIKKFVDKYGSICLFPEGMITHPATLGRFRTGAFNTNYPVIPITINYSKDITDTSILSFIFKLASKSKIDITVNIMDPIYPPFDMKKIENIRTSMAFKGNFLLSRVSNRDITDDN